ncbi:uncharacterized protein LOC108031748 [Drosophila biarmipes]|uniref:uncharacterized protein LOC108031748 n=1 Tax=Drosophila biarmipes TaxID=125945 RepID=UPI0007E6150F|nr:uncharacterized protein LOC108031748 [Drosophila biarmipes]
MFLNDIGQPLILQRGEKYGIFDEHSGALLLSTAAFNDPVVPQNWCKYVVGSEQEVLRLFISSFPEKCKSKTLKPNEPTQIVYNQTEITITLIPAGKNENGLESRLFYIDNGQARYLIVDRLSGYLDSLPKAHGSFHVGLGQGIDVLYVDEDLLSETDLNEDLYSFVHLVKPKFIYGLRQGELPKWLLDLRQI